MAQIIVMDGPGVGTTFELDAANTLGCGNHCNIRLESPNVKKEQATIRRKGKDYVLQAARPGEVLVNNQAIRQERKLVHGDMITIGDIMLLYGEESSEAPAKQSPSGTGKTPSSSGPSIEGPERDEESGMEIKSRERFYRDSMAALQSIGASKNASRNMEVLIKVSNAIMAKLAIRDLLQQLLDIIFSELPADRGTVFLLDQKTNKLWPMALKAREKLEGEMKTSASRTIIKEVMEKKEGVLVHDAAQDERFIMAQSIVNQQIHAAICVPLVGKKEDVLGILHLDTKQKGRHFTEEHLKLVTAIAMQAALAIENSLLVQRLGEQKRMEQELSIASDIQQRLLPQQIPQVKGIELFGMMKPAKEVGGDYYDFVASEDNTQIYICIGDVSGKGVPAGLVMVMARCFFRPLLSCGSTKMIVLELNKFLVADTQKDMFMSMLVLKWDAIQEKLTWTGAGHEHLLVYRAGTKKCEAIRAGGIVLGMMKKADNFFQEQELALATGDTIVLYTDGVTEAVAMNKEMFELERLIKTVEKYGHLSAEQICHSIWEDLKQFMSKNQQYDDITIVALKKK